MKEISQKWSLQTPKMRLSRIFLSDLIWRLIFCVVGVDFDSLSGLLRHPRCDLMTKLHFVRDTFMTHKPDLTI